MPSLTSIKQLDHIPIPAIQMQQNQYFNQVSSSTKVKAEKKSRYSLLQNDYTNHSDIQKGYQIIDPKQLSYINSHRSNQFEKGRKSQQPSNTTAAISPLQLPRHKYKLPNQPADNMHSHIKTYESQPSAQIKKALKSEVKQPQQTQNESTSLNRSVQQIINGDLAREDYRSGINFTPLMFNIKHPGRNQSQLFSGHRQAQTVGLKEPDMSTHPTLPELVTTRDDQQEYQSRNSQTSALKIQENRDSEFEILENTQVPSKSKHFQLKSHPKELSRPAATNLIPTKDYICQQTNPDNKSKSQAQIFQKNHNYFQSHKLQASNSKKHGKKKSMEHDLPQGDQHNFRVSIPLMNQGQGDVLRQHSGAQFDTMSSGGFLQESKFPEAEGGPPLISKGEYDRIYASVGRLKNKKKTKQIK